MDITSFKGSMKKLNVRTYCSLQITFEGSEHLYTAHVSGTSFLSFIALLRASLTVMPGLVGTKVWPWSPKWALTIVLAGDLGGGPRCDDWTFVIGVLTPIWMYGTMSWN